MMTRIQAVLVAIFLTFPTMSHADLSTKSVENPAKPVSCLIFQPSEETRPSEGSQTQTLIEDSSVTKISEETQAQTLLEAICMNSATQVKKLITEGHEVNQCDRFGLSLLHMAAGIGNPEIIR